MIALRMGSASMSADEGGVGVERGGSAARISSRRAVCHFGFVARRKTAQVRAEDVVSWL